MNNYPDLSKKKKINQTTSRRDENKRHVFTLFIITIIRVNIDLDDPAVVVFIFRIAW